MIVQADPFDQFIINTFTVEGGYSDEPGDPGNWTGGVCGSGILGGTYRGISSASYNLALRYVPDGLRDSFPATVRELDDGHARTIYQYAYWTRASCPAMPAAIALILGDAAVNQGIGGGVQCLQQALSFDAPGSSRSDGRIIDGDAGPVTVSAVAETWNHGGPGAGAQDLCTEFLYRRLVRYMSAGQWTTYGHGWSRRLWHLSLVAGNYLP